MQSLRLENWMFGGEELARTGGTRCVHGREIARVARRKATWMDAETPDNARDCKDEAHLHVAIQEKCIMHDWTDSPPCEDPED